MENDHYYHELRSLDFFTLDFSRFHSIANDCNLRRFTLRRKDIRRTLLDDLFINKLWRM